MRVCTVWYGSLPNSHKVSGHNQTGILHHGHRFMTFSTHCDNSAHSRPNLARVSGQYQGLKKRPAAFASVSYGVTNYENPQQIALRHATYCIGR